MVIITNELNTYDTGHISEADQREVTHRHALAHILVMMVDLMVNIGGVTFRASLIA